MLSASSRLTADALNASPVWEFVDDGFEEAALLRPVAAWNPIPADTGLLLIRVTCLTPEGHTLDGYIVGANGQHPPPYALTLFHSGDEFFFNVNLDADANKREWERLKSVVDLEDSVFPVSYRSPAMFSDGTLVQGVFPEEWEE